MQRSMPPSASGPRRQKLICNHIALPLTAIADFAALGETGDRFKTHDALAKESNGLWNGAAEKFFKEFLINDPEVYYAVTEYNF